MNQQEAKAILDSLNKVREAYPCFKQVENSLLVLSRAFSRSGFAAKHFCDAYVDRK